MRIRSIKPEFWRSYDVTALPRDVRLLFIGLWSYVDDNGVGVDDFRQIAADLFALEDDPSEVREYVREGLARLSRGSREGCGLPLVLRYTVDGKPYLFITGWDHQRVDKPNKARYPRPSDEILASANIDETPESPEPSRDSRETPAPGTEEQGNRGTGVKTLPRSAQPEEFERFWAVYPRKVGKGEARKAWAKVIRGGADPQQVINGAKRYASERANEPAQYTKHPGPWLNAGRWEDEPERHLRAVSGGHQTFRNPVDMSVYDEELLPYDSHG